MTLRVLISAGEVSGDQHLARVVRALKALVPQCEVRGMAGRECEVAGATLDLDCYRTGSVMGFSELVRSARLLLTSYRTMKGVLKEWKPDVVVLVDYPGFNLRLAREAHGAGAKVLYYIPPKVWAWKSGRVKVIKEFVDHIAAIFPFEVPFFKKHGYEAVTYVGHPLADIAPPNPERTQRPYTLLLLPGSRRFEIERILPPMVRVFEKLCATRPTLAASVLVAPTVSVEWVRSIAANCVSADTLARVRFVTGDALAEAQHAHAAILKSGTCNLEGALALLPFVCVYSGSWFSKVIVSAMVPLTEFSPVNIIRPATIHELMQVRLDEAQLERSVASVVDDGEERSRVLQGLQEVRAKLLAADSVPGSASAVTVAERVAQMIVMLAAQSKEGKAVHV